VKDPKAIQKALMAAKSIGDSIGLGHGDVLDNRHMADGGDVDRISMPFKLAAKRVPELNESAKAVKSGDTDWKAHQTAVDKFKPVSPFKSVPAMASTQQMAAAIPAKAKDIGAVSKNPKAYPDGYPVGLRLDIPAYVNKGVWIPTIHHGSHPSVAKELRGKALSYEPAAHVTEPNFNMSEKTALAIAAGAEKGSFARIEGKLKNTPHADIHAMAQKYLNHPDWAQVGMDPERHGYFYDRKTQRPVVSAQEALQVGPLVLARKPVYGDKKDYKFAEGGYLPPGHPEREANRAKFMEGAHPAVLNEDGTPKTLYHGSIEPKLKNFDPRKAVEVEGGLFFTDNPDVAHQYTYERAYGDIIGDEPLGEVHHVHVNMRNPYIHPTKPGQKIVDAIEMGRAVDHAKKHGHDGVIVKNIDDSIGQTGDMGDTYVAFHPTQIKSATGNRGTFNPSEPDITKATGGYIHKAKGGHIHDHAKAVRQALMAAKDAPISESTKTLKTQQDMFLAGKRKAMLYTHQEPALPQGAARLVTQHGVFHYNPALIDKKAIETAVANGRVNEILGLGPYSKTDVLHRVAKGEPLVGVIGRDSGGHEALSAVGTPSTAAKQAIAIARQLPAGGNVGVEHPAKVLMERASSRGSEP